MLLADFRNPRRNILADVATLAKENRSNAHGGHAATDQILNGGLQVGAQDFKVSHASFDRWRSLAHVREQLLKRLGPARVARTVREYDESFSRSVSHIAVRYHVIANYS